MHHGSKTMPVYDYTDTVIDKSFSIKTATRLNSCFAGKIIIPFTSQVMKISLRCSYYITRAHTPGNAVYQQCCVSVSFHLECVDYNKIVKWWRKRDHAIFFRLSLASVVFIVMVISFVCVSFDLCFI